MAPQNNHNHLTPAVNGNSHSEYPATEDTYVDLQYAKRVHRGLDSAETFAADFEVKPWEYCQDPTSTYLGLRFNKRDEFKMHFEQEKRDRIQHEEERIKKTRLRFRSNKTKIHLMIDLRKSRKDWISDVSFRTGNNVKDKWPVIDTEYEHQNVAEEKDPTHGFKAGVMYFKKTDAGWQGHTAPHDKSEPPEAKNKMIQGKFPNQKISMRSLLYEEKNNPIAQQPKPGDMPEHLRYFHLPSNNMRWVEIAMARYYKEKVQDHDDLKPLTEMTKAEKLLSREFWRGQLHGGGIEKGPVHAKHMRPRCSIVPLDTGSGTYIRTKSTAEIPTMSTQSQDAPKHRIKDFALFLPYLHWETDSRRARMAEIVSEEVSKREEETRRKAGKMSFPQAAKTIAAKLKKHKEPLKPTTPLGAYLMNVIKVYNEMDYEADEKLLRENLHQDPPMHIRRTLDQSYFLTLDDTGTRDKDQVVYRETKAGRSFHTRNTRVVMVDQLWLWILDDDTIITSFPRRWGRNKPDPSGVHKSLRERLSHNPEIQSIYDIALIIIDQCSRVFFDRTKPLDQRPEVMDLFASAIGNVSEQKTISFESFWSNLKKRSLEPHKYNSDTSSKYLNINPEGVLLRESQDIAEELRIMLRIYKQQHLVVKDFRRAMLHMNGESRHETNETRNLMKVLEALKDNEKPSDGINESTKAQHVPEFTIQEANSLIEQVEIRMAELEDLEDLALRTCQDLKDLLSLKQQQASIVEAKASLTRAEESVKQGRAIMLFTIVTICFLPLGFFTSFFGMNNVESNGGLHFNQQIFWMFVLSALIIIISISLAFSPRTRALIKILLKVPLVFIAEYLGFRKMWKKYVVKEIKLGDPPRMTLDERAQSALDRIYKHQVFNNSNKKTGDKIERLPEVQSVYRVNVRGQHKFKGDGTAEIYEMTNNGKVDTSQV